MRAPPFRSLWIPLALFALAPGADAKSDPKAENPLTRPAGAPDGNAAGKVRVERDLDKNRDRLKVEAEHIDTAQSFHLFLADAGGALVFVAALPPNGKAGEVEIEFDTKEGPPLPFGASSIDPFAGRAVEVRSGGHVYLTGTVPSLTGGGGGDGSGGGSGDWQGVKAPLVRPAQAPDANAHGYVELRRRQKDARQRFKVEADHVSLAITYTVYLETGTGSGVLQPVGVLPIDGPDEVELELDTGDGAALPFGVADVAALAGRRVEVRGSDGLTYLFGTVPLLGSGAPGNQQASADLGGTLGQASVKVKSKAKQPVELFELRVKQTIPKAKLGLFLFDAASGGFVQVGTVPTGSSGNGKFKAKTKKGAALPLGVAVVADLGGVPVQVRDAIGQVLFAGAVPAL